MELQSNERHVKVFEFIQLSSIREGLKIHFTKLEDFYASQWTLSSKGSFGAHLALIYLAGQDMKMLITFNP
jgi:hypothetical protein